MRNWTQKHIEEVIADELERLNGGKKNEHDVYRELHGNGTATHMKADIDRLPLKED